MNKGSTFSKKFHFVDGQDLERARHARAKDLWAPVPRTVCGNFDIDTTRTTQDPAAVTCAHCTRVIVDRTKHRLAGGPKSFWSRYAK